eukprot:1729126-Prymnesium_polylepis.1
MWGVVACVQRVVCRGAWRHGWGACRAQRRRVQSACGGSWRTAAAAWAPETREAHEPSRPPTRPARRASEASTHVSGRLRCLLKCCTTCTRPARVCRVAPTNRCCWADAQTRDAARPRPC